MKYKVINGSSAKDLEEKVNEALNDGWQLHFGVAVASDEKHSFFCQAMIKE